MTSPTRGEWKPPWVRLIPGAWLLLPGTRRARTIRGMSVRLPFRTFNHADEPSGSDVALHWSESPLCPCSWTWDLIRYNTALTSSALPLPRDDTRQPCRRISEGVIVDALRKWNPRAEAAFDDDGRVVHNHSQAGKFQTFSIYCRPGSLL